MDFQSRTLSKITRVLRSGKQTEPSRTAEGTKQVFVDMRAYDLRKGIPVFTGKKTNHESILKELTWFLRGESNINTLGCGIWDQWADKDGNIGPMYGAQWCRWVDTRIASADQASDFEHRGYVVHAMADPKLVVVTRTVNQLEDMVRNIKERPGSRRHLVTAWNPSCLPDETVSSEENIANGQGALAACHAFFHCSVDSDGFLDMFVYQRSADLFLGYPFNETSYAVLQTLIAEHTGLVARHMYYCTGDTHLYTGQIEMAEKLVAREIEGIIPTDTGIQLKIINPQENICDYQAEDLELLGYRGLSALRVAPQV